MYALENAIATDANVRFYLLAGLGLTGIVFFSSVMNAVRTRNDSAEDDIKFSFFMIFQVPKKGLHLAFISSRKRTSLFIARYTCSASSTSDVPTCLPLGCPSLQVLFTGGYEDGFVAVDERLIFCFTIVFGVTLVSILIGLVTDSVNEYMESLTMGTTKVAPRATPFLHSDGQTQFARAAVTSQFA